VPEPIRIATECKEMEEEWIASNSEDEAKWNGRPLGSRRIELQLRMRKDMDNEVKYDENH
jgi:hypothetical protein